MQAVIASADTANHPGPLSPRSAGCASASHEFAAPLRAENRVFNSFPVRFSPLVSEGFGEAARQLPPHRRTSSAYTSSGSTHDPIGAVCPRCGPLGALECRRRGSARRSDLHHCRRACRGRDRHHRRIREVRGQDPRGSPGAQPAHRRARGHPRRPGAVLQGRKGPSRRAQPIASRVRWTAIRILSRQRGHDTVAPSSQRYSVPWTPRPRRQVPIVYRSRLAGYGFDWRRTTESRSGQTEEVAFSKIHHSCEHLRSHAHRLNPLARGYLIWPEANSLPRHCCAPLRSTRSQRVSWPLTALQSSQPQAPRNKGRSGTPSMCASSLPLTFI